MKNFYLEKGIQMLSHFGPPHFICIVTNVTVEHTKDPDNLLQYSVCFPFKEKH